MNLGDTVQALMGINPQEALPGPTCPCCEPHLYRLSSLAPVLSPGAQAPRALP